LSSQSEAFAVEMLDTEVLSELSALGEDDLRALIDVYFDDVTLQRDRLRAAAADGDAEALAAAAHRVKGASLSIGAARVAWFASELEVAGRANDLGDCDALLRAFESELDPTRDALNAVLAVEFSR
jgi:HPt (histidine-containing phosphotransfer) domain-containing protein